MKNLFLKLSLAVLFLGLNTCVFAQTDYSHKFKAMRVPRGQIITIPLEVNYSSGFSWQLVGISDKTVLEFVKKESLTDLKKMAGSGGIEQWSFKSLNSGKAVIVFESRRPWEKDVPAQKKEEFNVFVE